MMYQNYPALCDRKGGELVKRRVICDNLRGIPHFKKKRNFPEQKTRGFRILDRSVEFPIPVMTKAERTRQYIIERSAAIINKKGMAGTSISDLMEATKLAKGGIYGNFASKDEICLEVFDYLTGIAATKLDSAIAGQPTAKKKLFSLLDHYHVHVALGDWGGCPLLNFGIEADDTNDELRQRVARSVKRSQQRLQKVIDYGKETGEFSKDTDSTAIAFRMFLIIQGAIFTTRVTKSPATMKTALDMLKKEIEEM